MNVLTATGSQMMERVVWVSKFIKPYYKISNINFGCVQKKKINCYLLSLLMKKTNKLIVSYISLDSTKEINLKLKNTSKLVRDNISLTF